MNGKIPQTKVYLLTGLIAFGVYVATLAPDLTWAHFGVDGGELITAVFTGGVPHPPGYPTYVLLGQLTHLWPFGTIAYRFNLFSAVNMAIAVGFTAATAVRFKTPSNNPHTWFIATSATGLTFAFAPLVWGQATITEVYSLNLACLAAFLWALLGGRPSWLVGLLLGLSCTTHPTSYFMLPLAFVYTPRINWYRLLVGWSLGLTPFLLIPLLAQSGSPIIWGQPTTIQGWWWLVTGTIYRGNTFALPSVEIVPRLQSWATILFSQFTWIGLPLVFWGWWVRHQESSKIIVFPLTAIGYMLYAFGYNTPDAIIFCLPALLLFSLFLTPSFQQLGWLALLLPLTSLMLNFQTQNLGNDVTIRPLMDVVWIEIPTNAIVLTPGDQTIFTAWYFQHVENQRPDVILVDSNLFAFDWYRQQLQQRHPDLTGITQDDLGHFQQRNQQKRPYCLVTLTGPEVICEIVTH